MKLVFCFPIIKIQKIDTILCLTNVAESPALKGAEPSLKFLSSIVTVWSSSLKKKKRKKNNFKN